jgi:ubiquinone/menaquinone biosynthesis C-methylase UbiE
MVLARFLGVVRRVRVVAVGHVRVVAGFLVLTVLIMLGGFLVVLGGVLVVLGGFPVVLSALMLCHWDLRGRMFSLDGRGGTWAHPHRGVTRRSLSVFCLFGMHDDANARDRYDAVRTTFGRAAAAYTASAGHADAEALARVVAFAEPHSGDRALDVATGAGHTALALAPHVAEVIALDITPEMLAETALNASRRRLGNVRVQSGAAEALPFADASFDIVTVRTAPHHFADIERAVREMARVTRAGGRVVVVDTIVPEDDALDREINAIELLRDPSHVRNYRASAWRRMLADAGLRVTGENADRYMEQGNRVDFDTWTGRAETTPEALAELRRRFRQASPALVEALDIVIDGDAMWFTLPKIEIASVKDR